MPAEARTRVMPTGGVVFAGAAGSALGRALLRRGSARASGGAAAAPRRPRAACSRLPAADGDDRPRPPTRRVARSNWVVGPAGEAAETAEAAEPAAMAALQRKARELGLGPTQVCTPEPPARFTAYEAWLDRGFHGEMAYLDRPDRRARRRDLNRVLPGVRAVIVSSLFYWPGQDGFPDAEVADQGDGGPRGEVSSYAWGEDYHAVLGAKLRALAEWLHGEHGGVGRFYVDTGAVLERELAERAGLGFVGKNTMLIHPRLGSGFFLGEIFTTLPLAPDPAPERAPSGAVKSRKNRCGSCTKCLDLCPTGAFAGPFRLDARRCISYLTIELKGAIPEELRRPMGTRIYGCDVCQRVCPWNRFSWEGGAGSPLFGAPPAAITAPRLLELLALDEPGFRARFAGSAVARIGRDRLLRNVAVALGNARDPAAIPALRRAAREEGPLVREHAQWALEQLGAGAAE